MYEPRLAKAVNASTVSIHKVRPPTSSARSSLASAASPGSTNLQWSFGNQPVLMRAQDNSAAQPGAAKTDSQLGAAAGCAGWNKDPQSLSKRAAEHYLHDQFHTKPPAPDTIVCSPTECLVHYNNGTSPFDVHVYMEHIAGNTVDVMRTSPPWGAGSRHSELCSYTYSCDASGTLHFKGPIMCI